MLYPPSLVSKTKTASKKNTPLGQQITKKTHSDRPKNHQQNSLRRAKKSPKKFTQTGQQITNKTPSNNSQWQKYYPLSQVHSQQLHNKHSQPVTFILKHETWNLFPVQGAPQTGSVIMYLLEWLPYKTSLHFIVMKISDLTSYTRTSVNLTSSPFWEVAQHLQILILEDGTNRLSQKIIDEIQNNITQHPKDDNLNYTLTKA